jgi:molybdopterin-guanine dinucleotide biosynthesis protein A
MLGIFVGGAARRMGGYPKGLLPAGDTGEALVVRLARLAREAGLSPVLVGKASPYQVLLPEVLALADEPKGVGPLGGLAALLRATRSGPVLAVACDMPYLSKALLERLASEAPEAPVLAPRSSEGMWEPLCARYEAARMLPLCLATLEAGERSFQALLARTQVTELVVSELERRELRDWDRPEDIAP